MQEDGAILYVLRVEDVESGLEWTSIKRYRDFFALYTELCAMSSQVHVRATVSVCEYSTTECVCCHCVCCDCDYYWVLNVGLMCSLVDFV